MLVNETARHETEAAEQTIFAPSHHAARTFSEMPLDVTRLFYMLYTTIDTQIILATTKAQLVLGVNALMAGALAVDRGAVQALLRSASGSAFAMLQLLLFVMMLMSMLASVYYALITARPNITPPSSVKNLFFFGHIADFGEQEFIDAFMNMTAHDVKRAVLAQINIRSKLAARKFVTIRYSLNFLFLALTFWAVSRLLSIFIA